MSYVRYPNVTREILDTVCVGDLIKINEWKVPLRVKAVSEIPEHQTILTMLCGQVQTVRMMWFLIANMSLMILSSSMKAHSILYIL